MEKFRAILLKVLLYGSFLMGTFLLFLYWTFPYTRIFDRVISPIQKRARLKIQVKDLRPHYLTGVSIKGLNIQKQVKKGTAEVQINRIVANLSILPLFLLRQEIQARVEAAQGSLDLTASHRSRIVDVDLKIKDINLGALGPPNSAFRHRSKSDPPRPLLAMIFSPVYGRVNGSVKLKVPLPGAKVATKKTSKKKTRRRRRYRRRGRGLDITKVSGRIKLRINGFSVGPGYFATQQHGEVPVPLVQLGRFVIDIRIDKGRVTIMQCFSKGGAGELFVKGFVVLRRAIPYSYFQGEFRFRVSESFKNGLNTPVLSMLKGLINSMGPGKSGFHLYKGRIPFRGRPRLRRVY